MPDWRRILVGDAFKLSSNSPNWYRDLFLIWPFLLFSIAASALFTAHTQADRLYGYKAAGCALVALALVKEKRIILLVAAAYVGMKLGVLLIFHPDWRILLVFLALAALVFAITRKMIMENYRPSYKLSGGTYILDLIVGVGGLLAAAAVITWLKVRQKPHFRNHISFQKHDV
jgi:hypothetical protein